MAGQYGESIYGTRGGPFKPWKFGAATRKGKTVYVLVFNWLEERVKLPALGARIVDAALMSGGSVRVNQTDAGIEIEVPAAGRQAIDTVIALELDRDSGTLPAVEVGGWVSLTQGKKATASAGYRNQAGDGTAGAPEHPRSDRRADDLGVSVVCGGNVT